MLFFERPHGYDTDASQGHVHSSFQAVASKSLKANTEAQAPSQGQNRFANGISENRILRLRESGVCENNAHRENCGHCNPAPQISMLENRGDNGRRNEFNDERLFRRRLHSRRKPLTSTLKFGARGPACSRLLAMSVIFTDTGRLARVFSVR